MKKGKYDKILTVAELIKTLQDECEPDWHVYFYGEALPEDEHMECCGKHIDTSIEGRVEFNIPHENE